MDFIGEKGRSIGDISRYFITFEGNDGSGKGSQIKSIMDFVKKRVKELNLDVNDVVETFEPGGTFVADKIRDIILLPVDEYKGMYGIENEIMDKRAEVLLYLASRAQHTVNYVMPHLKNKDIVVCSRYADSSFAYQGFGREINRVFDVNLLNDFATYSLKPGLTIYLYLEDVHAGIERKLKQKSKLDRLELENEDFILRVKEGFDELLKSEPNRVKAVNASKGIDDVRREIEAILDSYLLNNFNKL